MPTPTNLDDLVQTWKKHADVHTDVEDVAAFVPTVEGRNRTFVLWSADARKQWEETGVLAGHWGGSKEQLMMAVASCGALARFDVEARAWEAPVDFAAPRLLSAHQMLGTFVWTRDAQTTDLHRLLDAFRHLRKNGVVALPCTSFTQSEGWSDVVERQRSPNQTAVFWTEQGHDAFDACGNLHAPLFLYWRGDAERIAGALRRVNLSVVVPTSEHGAIEVASAHSPVRLPTFNEVRTEMRPATDTRADTGGQEVGTWKVASRITTPELRPIDTLATHEKTLVIGYGYDSRGWPDIPGYALSLPSGEVKQTLKPEGAGGMLTTLEVLADGRFLIASSDHMPLSDESPCAPPAPAAPGPRRRVIVGKGVAELASKERSPALVLRTLDATGQRIHRTHCMSHGPAVRAVDVAADGRTAILPTRAGAMLFELAPDGPGTFLRWVGPKQNAYPMVAITRVASHVALGATGDLSLFIHALSDGNASTELDPYRGLSLRGGRGFTHFFFEPKDRALVVGTRTEDGRRLRFFDTTTGTPMWEALEARTHAHTSAAFSRDGTMLVIGREDGSIAFYSVPEGAELGTGSALRGAVKSLFFGLDGQLVAGSEHGEVALLQRSS